MSFVDAVQERSGHARDAVEATLADHGIVAQPTPAAPVPLEVTHLRFSGVKRREGRDDEAFEFDRELGAGLWAVTSEAANLAGKSSVLFVIRWALTGRSHLTDDVRSWITDVRVDGNVGGEAFSVRFTADPDGVSGSIRAGASVVAEFDQPSFEEVMASFFLDRLRLDPTPFWQSRPGGTDEGDRREFGWTSYFPALHLRADNLGMLLGDQAQGGQPGVLMQVFLGLPWALTVAKARVADRHLSMQRAARRRRREEDDAARQAELVPLRQEHERAVRALRELRETRAPIGPEEADRRLASYSAALTDEREAERQVTQAYTAVALTQQDLDEATKRADAIEQTRVVRPLLGRLTPSVCPRCSTGIGQERVQRETDDHQCSVCAEPLTSEQADEDELEEAREFVRQAAEERDTAEHELVEAQQAHTEAVRRREESETSVRELEARVPAEQETRELETTIARLEGRLERPELVAAELTTEADAAYDIVHAALAEAQERRQDAAADLLTELGQHIVDLGQQFGIENLEEAQPTLGAQLRVRIGSAWSPFSSRTGGERLRLRLATVIALLRVGRARGIGRHPGLLLLDSPGAEEMVEGDVRAILAELATVCEELPALEVICATARAAEVREVVADERIIHGTDYGEVW